MKAVLMAFSPKECDEIFSGKKTVDVRKLAPKFETPYRVYMYCTKRGRPLVWWTPCAPYADVRLAQTFGYSFGEAGKVSEAFNGKVVGEFVCDKVTEYGYDVIACAKFEVDGAYVKEEKRYNAGACLSAEEMYEYSKGKSLCGLHITKAKPYDTPKALSEFRKPDEPFHTVEINENGNIGFCDGYIDGEPITRPPQSFCYVEEIEE